MAYGFNDDKSKVDILSAVYPVGSIYMSVNNVNPGELFGGVWTVWGAGRVPVGVNTSDTNFNTVEKTGGASTHALTVAQLPKHRHSYQFAPSASVSGLKQGTGSQMEPLMAYQDVQTNATDYTGSGNPHNNLQPYITCYMWKRTA